MTNKIVSILIIGLLSFLLYGVYSKTQKSIKSKRLECQSLTTTFEKIFLETPVNEAIKTLKNGNYEIISHIEYSKYMKSNLVNILTKNQSDKILEDILEKNMITKKESLDKKTIIDYYIYENDKEDSGKKNNEAKSYAGYLVFEFKYENKLIYKIQTDYMNLDGSDINERMNCVMNAPADLFVQPAGEHPYS